MKGPEGATGNVFATVHRTPFSSVSCSIILLRMLLVIGMPTQERVPAAKQKQMGLEMNF